MDGITLSLWLVTMIILDEGKRRNECKLRETQEGIITEYFKAGKMQKNNRHRNLDYLVETFILVQVSSVHFAHVKRIG